VRKAMKVVSFRVSRMDASVLSGEDMRMVIIEL
jgi:hypothetical protein